MTVTNFSGAQPFLWPQLPFLSATITNTLSMTATGQKIAAFGRVLNKDGATKTLKQVHIPFGTVVKAGASTVNVDIQGWSGSASPLQPDGSTIAGGGATILSASLSSNTVVPSGTLSTQPSVAYGQPIAIVISWGVYLGADSIVINGLSSLTNFPPFPSATFAPSTWTAQATCALGFLLEFDDGTFGALDNSIHYSAANTHTYNSGSTPDEYAMYFQLPFPAKCTGAMVYMGWGGNDNRDFDIVLYDSASSALATVSNDGSWRHTGTVPSHFKVNFPPVSLSANTTYRLSLKPTTANSIVTYSFDVGNASHLQAWGGANIYTSTRTDAGAWTDTNTRRVIFHLMLAAFDDGAGSGGLAYPIVRGLAA